MFNTLLRRCGGIRGRLSCPSFRLCVFAMIFARHQSYCDVKLTLRQNSLELRTHRLPLKEDNIKACKYCRTSVIYLFEGSIIVKIPADDFLGI